MAVRLIGGSGNGGMATASIDGARVKMEVSLAHRWQQAIQSLVKLVSEAN